MSERRFDQPLIFVVRNPDGSSRRTQRRQDGIVKVEDLVRKNLQTPI